MVDAQFAGLNLAQLEEQIRVASRHIGRSKICFDFPLIPKFLACHTLPLRLKLRSCRHCSGMLAWQLVLLRNQWAKDPVVKV